MKKYKIFTVFLLVSALFWCCKKTEPVKPITPQEIEAHIRFLSDDLLEGRSVGSRGLAIAALYQENYFRSLGLEPAFGRSFRQHLILKGSLPDQNASLEIFSENTQIDYEIYEDFLVNSEREDCPAGVEGELVYCGYLIQAPEREWDDIKGADLKGKVLLVEVNEPGNFNLFKGINSNYFARNGQCCALRRVVHIPVICIE